MEFALITGATSGIGYELAGLFAQNGYGLVLVSSNKERLENTKKQLNASYHVPIHIYEQDLTKLGAAAELYQKIQKKELLISVLINNAGFGLVGFTDTIDLQNDEEMITINVINLVSLCKLFIADMYRHKQGKILNVSSTGAFQPGPYTSTYFASKAFVLSYSRAIRYEAKSKGIHISTLCPGATKTGFFRREGTKMPEHAMSPKTVARIAYKGLMKNKEIIVPGLHNRFLQLFPVKLKMISVAKMKQS